MATADFSSRARLMKNAQPAAITRSIGRRFGASSRERLRTISCCFSSSDSATTARTPLGRKHFETTSSSMAGRAVTGSVKRVHADVDETDSPAPTNADRKQQGWWLACRAVGYLARKAGSGKRKGSTSVGNMTSIM
jgi:hypothetical protein